MIIKLSDIKPSPKAIRTTWEEEALDQLAQSIKENGLIVPIKVRPNGNGKYEIVYGHRRVKAMRRAGITETEAIVEGIDDTRVLVEALIENVHREDMTPLDIARALYILQEETGWSQKEMARRGIMPVQTISRTMSLLRETPHVQSLVARGETGGKSGGTRVTSGQVTPFHVEVTRAVGIEANDRQQVLEKAASEGLTAVQTRRLAETIKAAPSGEAKKKLLEWRFDPMIHDPDRVKARAKIYGVRDPMYMEAKPGAETDWRNTPEAKALIENIQWVQRDRLIAWKTSSARLPQEARQHIARLIRKLAYDLEALADQIEA